MVLFDVEDEDDFAFSVHGPPSGKGTVTFCPSRALCSLEAYSDPLTHSFVLQTSKKLREEPD